ncbi:MAG: hypothetical protein E6J34_20455 [Chloroflexi bacterium]|nr:MAG: hypothetical protein E6J34_20455 [Chloroflexota bacterium]
MDYHHLLNVDLLEEAKNIRLTLEITAQEARSGSRRMITFQSNMHCPLCSQGMVPGLLLAVKRCKTCEGYAVLPHQRQLQVDIPPGIANGTCLHLPSEGLLGVQGAEPRGSLYITVQVQADVSSMAADAPMMVDLRDAAAAQAPPSFFNQPTVLGQPTAHPSSPQPFPGAQIPSRLGNYRIIRQLGSGGNGNVYLGQHIRLNTLAALKVLQQITPQDEQSFLREAQTLAMLKHPHILRLLDFGTEGTIPFLVMDYAQGGTLRDLHPRGSQLSAHLVVAYAKQIAVALQYAHDQRVIHRDVKPENMLVDQRIVLLSDFGIAVAAHRTHSMKTQELFGTAYYMAPEQLHGKPHLASDQYALAVVVYEWLCGVTPFGGARLQEIAIQHITMPPPPLHAHVPSISLAVEQVVLKALAKDPHQRFASVLAFVQALEQAASV